MKLGDRIAVVTGAGSGLGRGIAMMLAERGASVAAIDACDEARYVNGHDLVVDGGW